MLSWGPQQCFALTDQGRARGRGERDREIVSVCVYVCVCVCGFKRYPTFRKNQRIQNLSKATELFVKPSNRKRIAHRILCFTF